ncbi:MAG: carbohydrate binding domain-containing protein [Armatimonadota bacterium]
MRTGIWLLLFGLLLYQPAVAAPPDWSQSLYLGNDGYWRHRLRVDIRNSGSQEAQGAPVAVPIGPAAEQADLVGAAAESVRVVDSDGIELLYTIAGPQGQAITHGPIPDGSALILPAVCPAGGSASLFVYFDNPSAWPVPDFLQASLDIRNGGVEDGSGPAPEGWRNDSGDAQHIASWVTDHAHTGTHALKLSVAPGASSDWISTRQRGIYLTPGARYRLRGWVKADDVSPDGWAGWYAHIGNSADPMILVADARAGSGSFDWRQVTAEFDVPADCDQLEVGTVLWGTGTAWFDDLSLDTTAAQSITAKAADVETLSVSEIEADPAWYDDNPDDDLHWDYRLPVKVLNLHPAATSGLAQVDISPFLERRLGVSENSLRVVGPAGLVPAYLLGGTVLFDAHLPANTVQSYYLYLSTDRRARAAPASDYAGLLSSSRSLVQNPSFESGRPLPNDWATSVSPGAVLSLDSPGKFGRAAAKLAIPEGVAPNWSGWRQDVPVQPNATYFCGVWMKTQDVTDGSVALYAHYRTASGEFSRYTHYAGAGPDLSGTNDWTLLSGAFTMPPDCTDFQLHLTMNAHGTVWHDGVVLARVIPATTGPLESRDPAAGLQLWPVNALVKVFRDDPAPDVPREATISAARGEYEPLQLALRSTTAMAGLTLEVDPPSLAAGDRLTDITTAVVGYVPVDHPSGYYQSSAPSWQRRFPVGEGQSDGWAGWWPDPLTPANTFDLRPNETQPLWITVRVPDDAKPGDYTGALRLLGPAGPLKTIPFTVHVYDFALPAQRHLRAVYDIRLNDWWGAPDQARPAVESFMSHHRLSPDTVSPDPVITYSNGKVTADFAAFDAAAERYFSDLNMPHTYTPWYFYGFGWGLPPAPFQGENPYPGAYPYSDADPSQLRPQYKAAYQACLRAYWEHMKAKGWEDKVVLYLSDEPFAGNPRIIAQLNALAAMVHEVDPAIPIYVSTWQYVPEWKGAINIWGLGHFGGVSPERLAQVRAQGDRIIYTTDGQMCIDTPYLAVERLLPYYCWTYGAEGYEFWGFTWLLDYNPYQFGWFPYLHQTVSPGNSYWVRYPNGDGFLAYPGGPIGHDGPVASLRSEQAREGAEDYEYLWLLRDRLAKARQAGLSIAQGEGALARAASLVAIPNAGGKMSSRLLPDPDAVLAARDQLAAAIEALSPPADSR